MVRAGSDAGFWRAVEGGVSVAVKVQPKSRRPGIGGIAPTADGARLRIGVSEAAEDGRANRAACAALARALGVPASAVTLAAGAASREKLLHVAGDPSLLSVRLSAL
ncbi:MAG TPA: DUF167 family protein [Acetobacteraceae bacterium]|nr:DUF167 family protein [Acetobacteraceae bacterium]